MSDGANILREAERARRAFRSTRTQEAEAALQRGVDAYAGAPFDFSHQETDFIFATIFHATCRVAPRFAGFLANHRTADHMNAELGEWARPGADVLWGPHLAGERGLELLDEIHLRFAVDDRGIRLVVRPTTVSAAFLMEIVREHNFHWFEGRLESATHPTPGDNK